MRVNFDMEIQMYKHTSKFSVECNSSVSSCKRGWYVKFVVPNKFNGGN